METKKIEKFNIIGIATKTTNENGQSSKDIPLLWERVMAENILASIPNKTDNTIYCLYTDYEKDHTRPYTTIIGCKVSSLEKIPDGMVSKTIEANDYAKFGAKGDLTSDAVYNAWLTINETKINRLYTTDFEVYDERAENPKDGEADIFVGINTKQE